MDKTSIVAAKGFRFVYLVINWLAFPTRFFAVTGGYQILMKARKFFSHLLIIFHLLTLLLILEISKIFNYKKIPLSKHYIVSDIYNFIKP